MRSVSHEIKNVLNETLSNTYYTNGKVKSIIATEENAFEIEIDEYDSMEECINGMCNVLRDNFEVDINTDEIEDRNDLFSEDGYQIRASIVRSDEEETEECNYINDELRQPIIDLFN